MKYIFAFILCSFTLYSFSQATQSKPVTWNFEVIKADNDEYIFKATAILKDQWAIYSQHTSEGGPVPLSFTYEEKSSLIADTKEESEAIKKMSELFDVEVIKFKKEAIFTQRFSPNESEKRFKGTLRFMCCDEQRCLPPTEVPFDVAY